MTTANGATCPAVAVIGGGLSGLAAAIQLQQLALASHRALRVLLIEAGPRLGGLVGTEQVDGYLIDTGADSFLTNKPGAVQLCRQVGLESELIGVDPAYKGALVLSRGRPRRIPEGFALLAPSQVLPILRTPILSWPGKLRLLGEYFVPRSNVAGDESLAQFARRRFGREALDRLIQPLVGGITTSDPERLSMLATLGRFRDQERTSGSLMRAAMQNRDRAAIETGARYGLFAALRRGMQSLVDACEQQIAGQGGEILPGTRVTRLRNQAAGFVLHVESAAARGRGAITRGAITQEPTTQEPITVQGVVIATPAQAAATLVSEISPSLSRELAGIESATSAIVVTGHQLANVRHPLDAYGLVIPEVERRELLAVSFSSRKFPDRAPAGCVQLRSFIGGDLHPHACERDDAELIAVTCRELRALLGVEQPPEVARVIRYPSAMPQYRVGHLDRVARIESLLADHSGLAIAGNALHGVGVPDVVSQGTVAAGRVWQSIVGDTPAIT